MDVLTLAVGAVDALVGSPLINREILLHPECRTSVEIEWWTFCWHPGLYETRASVGRVNPVVV
jgi:hypothetical protein